MAATSAVRRGSVMSATPSKREFPSVEVCRWWLRNHTNMPRDWEMVQKLYDKAMAKERQRGAETARAGTGEGPLAN